MQCYMVDALNSGGEVAYRSSFVLFSGVSSSFSIACRNSEGCIPKVRQSRVTSLSVGDPISKWKRAVRRVLLMPVRSLSARREMSCEARSSASFVNAVLSRGLHARGVFAMASFYTALHGNTP